MKMVLDRDIKINRETINNSKQDIDEDVIINLLLMRVSCLLVQRTVSARFLDDSNRHMKRVR